MFKNNLKSVYNFFDELFKNILSDYCKSCKYPDCLGYVLVQDSEVDNLKNIGVSLIEINDDTIFLDSFRRDENGNIDLEEIKPKCKLRNTVECSIYKNRPLICRMYPFSFIKENNDIYFCIHNDCDYTIKHLLKNESIITKIEKYFNNIDSKILENIIKNYEKAWYLEMPGDAPENNISKLFNVNSLIINQGEIC